MVSGLGVSGVWIKGYSGESIVLVEEWDFCQIGAFALYQHRHLSNSACFAGA